MVNRFLYCFVLTCALWSSQSVLANSTPSLPPGVSQFSTVEGITEYRLSNGLTVLLMPDQSKPTVTVNVTYLVGSRHENYGETGMAHLLEHMMFKGSPKFPSIDEEFDKRGMTSNASTTLDYTNYYEQFEASDSSNLQWALRMEADRMVNANIAKNDLDSEMTVVRNEYEIGENSPMNVLLKRLQSAAYDWHNYRNAVIGNRSDIENVKIENLQAFYRTYYQPDNAVLTVTGKFDERETLKWIAADFGVIPKPTHTLPIFWTVEPTQDGEHTVTVRRKGDTQIVMVAYKIPADLHADNDLIDAAADMLTDKPTGRLYKSLVETNKAVDVFEIGIGGVAPGLQVIGAVVKKGDPLEPVRDALIAGVENFGKILPTAEEVERTKLSNRNEYEKILSDPETIGLELSESIGLGDWRYFFQHNDQLQQITAEKVAGAAKRYFKRDNRVVGIFIPDDQPQRAEISAAPDMKDVMRNFAHQSDGQIAEAFDPSPENIEKRLTRGSIGGLNVVTLPKKTRRETVNVVLTLHWGDEKSLFGKKLVAGLTENMLMRGNSKYTHAQLKDEFDKLRITGTIKAFETTRENLPAALALVAQVLKEPSFPESEFVQLKKQVLSELESGRSDPATLASQAIDQHFNHYPKGDWRSRETIDEQIKVLKDIQLSDVKKFHRDFYGASKGELTIVGDVDVSVVNSVIKQRLGHWRSKAAYERIDDTYIAVAPTQMNINTPDKESGYYLARMNLNLNDEDPIFPALVVANYIFGGGASLNSRIMIRIREKEGLSYGGGSSLRVNSTNNAAKFQISAVAAPQNLTKVASAIDEELNRVLKDGFSSDEVARAQSGLKQRAVQIRSQDDSLALDLNEDQYDQRTMAWTEQFEEKISTLTVDQVNAAFREVIDPSKLTVVIAGDEAKRAMKERELLDNVGLVKR